MDSLRISLALAVLKSKPPGQSYRAYILDLRSTFPLVSTHNAVSNTVQLWRDHALALEKDLAELKSKLENKQIQSLISTSPTQGTGTDCDALNPPQLQQSNHLAFISHTSTQVTKKKSKKLNPSTNLNTPDERGVHISSNPSNVIPMGMRRGDNQRMTALPSELVTKNLFVSLDAFLTMACLPDQSKLSLDLFISATYRIIDELSTSLDMVIKTTASLDFLETLHTICRLLIESSFPLLLSAPKLLPCSVPVTDNPTYMAHFLDKLLLRILIPLVRSFLHLSSQWLDPLSACPTSDTGRGKLAVDPRPAVLAFLQSALSTILQLKTLKRSERNPLANAFLMELALMQQSLMLDVLRQLDRMLLENAALNATGKLRPQQRVQRLVVKETVWYICSALHVIVGFDPLKKANAAANLGGLDLLKKAVRSLFVAILVRQERRNASRYGLGGSELTSALANAGSTCDGTRIEECSDQPSLDTVLILDDKERRMLLRIFECYSALP